jgi:twitching motility protein PilT
MAPSFEPSEEDLLTDLVADDDETDEDDDDGILGFLDEPEETDDLLMSDEGGGRYASDDTIPFKQSYTIDDLLRLLCEKGASDLHFSAGAPPVIRLHGDLVPLAVPTLTEDKAHNLIMAILTQQEREKFISTMHLDCAYELKGLARFRCNIYMQHKGMAGAFRIIPVRMPTIDELGLPEVTRTIAESRSGICIVTGPTGSGKSTTLASIINHINETRRAHIITVEDPIEFFHTNKECLIDHREVGEHANSFADAVRAALREDPDIILVGEMRDLETIYQAIKVAETGCLVFATLHTNNAAKTVDRMIDVFPAKQQAQIRSMLAISIRAIVAQQLLKKIDGKGRVAAQEILLSASGLSNLIREGKTAQIPNFINMGRSMGMQSMDQALMQLVERGEITKNAAIEKCQDPANFGVVEESSD